VLNKIVSGGQTGADQAALDAAISCNMSHGGWIPKGRKTESGPLAPGYALTEMKSGRFPKRTRQNVQDSDGTVVFFYDKLSGGSKYTLKMANKLRRPCLALDFNAIPAFEIIANLHEWVKENNIGNLNVAGPRASKDARIYNAVKFIMTCIILLSASESKDESSNPNPGGVIENTRLRVRAKTLGEAANRFISELPAMDRVFMANMEVEDLDTVHLSFGPFVKNQFLHEEDSPLLISCREEIRREDLGSHDAATVIIHRVWENLRENDELRLMR
jgi:hypothetical protein